MVARFSSEFTVIVSFTLPVFGLLAVWFHYQLAELLEENRKLREILARSLEASQTSWLAYCIQALKSTGLECAVGPILLIGAVSFLIYLVYYYCCVRPALRLYAGIFRESGDGCEGEARPYRFRVQESLREGPITDTDTWPRGMVIAVGKRGGVQWGRLCASPPKPFWLNELFINDCYFNIRALA